MSKIETANAAVTKARLNPGRQWVAINNVEFPVEVQPRAGIDMEWVRQLSEFRKEGSEFPPIKVFQTPDGRLIGAEGHHRSLAMFKADETDILCDVVDGTMEDAIVFAAGSNRSNGVKPMGPKDISKAVRMLLVLPDWQERSALWIGEHVGCFRQKVQGIREKMMAEGLIPLIAEIRTKDGSRCAIRNPRKHDDFRIKLKTERKNGRTYEFYQSYVNNKRVRSLTESGVEEKIKEICRQTVNRKIGLGRKKSERWFSSHGFTGSLVGFVGLYPGLGDCWVRSDILAASCEFSDSSELPNLAGRLIACRRVLSRPLRMVVLCYPEDGPAKVLDLYRAEGFEFLTPEELEESLK